MNKYMTIQVTLKDGRTMVGVMDRIKPPPDRLTPGETPTSDLVWWVWLKGRPPEGDERFPGVHTATSLDQIADLVLWRP